MSYTVPAAIYHTSQVPLETVHATIFFFDASRGYTDDAGVSLRPKHLPKAEQSQDPGGMTATSLVAVVDAVRKWELACDEALSTALKGAWSEARDMFEKMAATWQPLPEDTAGTQVTSSLNDVKSLNCYQEMALTLELWAGYVEEGREYIARANEKAAEAAYQLAKQTCQSMSDRAIAGRCQAVVAAS